MDIGISKPEVGPRGGGSQRDVVELLTSARAVHSLPPPPYCSWAGPMNGRKGGWDVGWGPRVFLCCCFPCETLRNPRILNSPLVSKSVKQLYLLRTEVWAYLTVYELDLFICFYVHAYGYGLSFLFLSGPHGCKESTTCRTWSRWERLQSNAEHLDTLCQVARGSWQTYSRVTR